MRFCTNMPRKATLAALVICSSACGQSDDIPESPVPSSALADSSLQPFATYMTANPRAADAVALARGVLTEERGCIGLVQENGVFLPLIFPAARSNIKRDGAGIEVRGTVIAFGSIASMTGGYGAVDTTFYRLDPEARRCATGSVFYVG